MLNLFLVTILVPDYDRAIAWYRDVLGFALAADDALGDGKRWVVMKPNAQSGASVLLALADGEAEMQAVGNQTAGRVAFFVETDDFARDYAQFRARGAEFIEEPRHEPYGTVAVMRDLFGNYWDLIQPTAR